MFAFIQNIGPWQFMICVAVIALLFGANKIPDIARSLGKAKGEFKKGLEEGEKDCGCGCGCGGEKEIEKKVD